MLEMELPYFLPTGPFCWTQWALAPARESEAEYREYSLIERRPLYTGSRMRKELYAQAARTRELLNHVNLNEGIRHCQF